MKLLLWKIATGAIPVRARSFRLREVSDPSPLLCFGCGQHYETVLHVFHGCTLARLLWSTSNWAFDISRIPESSAADWIHILLNAESLLGIQSRSFNSFILNAALIMDVLWFSCNKFLHEGEPVVVSDLQHSLSLVGFQNTLRLG